MSKCVQRDGKGRQYACADTALRRPFAEARGGIDRPATAESSRVRDPPSTAIVLMSRRPAPGVQVSILDWMQGRRLVVTPIRQLACWEAPWKIQARCWLTRLHCPRVHGGPRLASRRVPASGLESFNTLPPFW